jgi:hypothetical protein
LRSDDAERPLAGCEVVGIDAVEQALLDGVADAQHAALELAPRRRQVDAADAAIAFVLAAFDQAATFEAVEQAYQRRTFYAECSC